MNTYDSLLARGIFINDLPGLKLSDVEVSYYYARFEEQDYSEPNDQRRAEKIFAALLEGLQTQIAAFNSEYRLAETIRELRIHYLDDEGNFILGRVEEATRDSFPITVRDRVVRADLIANLLLSRVFSAEGADGQRQVRYMEVKRVGDAIEKYLAAYELGWQGLFRQRESLQEREDLFRSFRPFKFPIFFTRETLRSPRMTMQLGLRTAAGDSFFKPVTADRGDVTLAEALAF